MGTGSLAHASVETAAALIAASAAYLVLGRVRDRPHRHDLVLAAALALLAASNLLFQLMPSLVRGERGPFSWWAGTAATGAGAAAFALAAHIRAKPLARPRRAIVFGAAASLVVLGAIAATVALAAPSARPPASAQLAIGFLFALAAAGFSRHGRGDDLRRWFAAAAVLAAFARVAYAVFPPWSPDAVSVGDALRLAFYLLLLVGAAREVRGYWEALAQAAVAEERRRFAREIHDGLAQELAYIRARAARGAPELAAAAARALDESRRAITALTRVDVEPLHAAVAQTAEELALRLGFSVRLRLSEKLDVDAAVQEELLRILREALTNAARHGRARVVTVSLDHARGRRLRIDDDGGGFDTSAAGREGSFGLVSMRERAHALGGELRLSSRPGAGTTIEVQLP